MRNRETTFVAKYDAANHTTPNGDRLAKGHGQLWLDRQCRNMLLIWTRKRIAWTAKERDLGQKAEAIMAAAPRRGLPYERYYGSSNRLGKMIRQGTVILRRPPKS
jgi:hypothetical protein